MRPDEKVKMLELIDKLLEANQKDEISSQSTRELIQKNISSLREGFVLDEMKTPSEHGYSIGLGLGPNINEFRVSEEVLDAAYAIDEYFRTL